MFKTKAASPDSDWRRFCGQLADFLSDSFAFGGMLVDLTANEFLEVGFAPIKEFIANPRKLVRPGFGHFQSELPDLASCY